MDKILRLRMKMIGKIFTKSQQSNIHYYSHRRFHLHNNRCIQPQRIIYSNRIGFYNHKHTTLAKTYHRRWFCSTNNSNNGDISNNNTTIIQPPSSSTSRLANSMSKTEHDHHRITGTSNAVLSTFDMFSIGIGPSSSHTVGPMRAARKFIDRIPTKDLETIKAIKVELYGSLACTGLGHGTDLAVLMGLEGETPEEIDPKYAFQRSKIISKSHKLRVHNKYEIKFIPLKHLVWNMDQTLPYHSNGMRLIAYNNELMDSEHIINMDEYYSVGGGFVTNSTDINKHNVFRYIDDSEYNITYSDNSEGPSDIDELNKYKDILDDCPPLLFNNGKDLFRLARAHDMKISELVFENELFWRSKEDVISHLMRIWDVMNRSIENGINTRGILPGEIQATRRAPILYRKLMKMNNGNGNNSSNNKNGDSNSDDESQDPLTSIIGPHYQDWLYCWAMAVNEENAAGGKVVTAPTNGAAGVIPAVIKYYTMYHKNACEEGIRAMLLTAAAVGMLYKRGASLSAAEVGCQGEVGVASSMAAAALCEVMGGTLSQVESAAEIAMEHSLGLTCDPIGGYVQVPCIERNAIGGAKAVASARMALLGDGKQIVSLDAVIETMRQTGQDMSHKYKETALAGLAVNVPVC